MFDGFISVMKQGGVDMVVLLLLSIAVVWIVIERFLYFSAQHGDTKSLL